MAIATATAIGLGITALSTGVSFTQAAKQGKMQKKAEADAQKYMADARKKLEVNFYEQLGIQKEPYELEREALLSAGAQAIEAGVESERGAASIAGRVQMAQQEGQRKIAGAMGQELLGLEKLAASEESRLRDTDVNLDLSTVQGAQLAARDAEQAKTLANKQGFQGVTSLATQAAALFPDYKKAESVKELDKISGLATQAGLNQQQFQKQIASLASKDASFSNLSGVGELDPMKFNSFMGSLSPEYLKKLGEVFIPGITYKNPNEPSQGAMGPQF
jgi:hypothetical protein